MLFNSSAFFVFLIIVFLAYWKTATYSNKLRKWVLLLASYIFYGWWDWRFLILIIISSVTDFIIGKTLFEKEKKQTRKILLLLSIFINIGILFCFKYFNFFIASFQALTGFDSNHHWSTLQIILPVGISFYTFQTLSYTIDIYRRKIQPTRSALTFFTFVAFFPQLVAGPIERAKRLIPQLEKKPAFSYPQAVSGLKLMVWGLFKKMVIADQLAVLVDAIYAQPNQFNGWEIILGTFLFGYQIYCDFSGYSDIAIGTARLFGVELMTNFKTPYFAHSFRNFWHRWHISLSTWFRDYIYVPLGGNQTSSAVWIKNIFITFVISGLWHGANVTFLLWGAIHAVFYVAEKQVSPALKIPGKIKSSLGWGVTFVLVNFSWIFFRAESWQHLKTLFLALGTNHSTISKTFSQLLFAGENFTPPGRMILFIFPLFLLAELFLKEKNFDQAVFGLKKQVQWGIFYLLVLMILFFGVLNSAPQFIYFQF